MAATHKQRQPGRGAALADYVPLLALVAVVALASAARVAAGGAWDGTLFLRQFMGLFFVFLALLKLFDLPGFADGFQMYDLLAHRWRPYALAYPLVELAFGLAYLANAAPLITNVAVLVVMSFGSAGVILALRRGLDLECACLGSSLKVPLSTVAVIENGAMAVMAALALVRAAGGTG